MDERIAGIILAGGRARRMGGGDKCLRLFTGRPLLAHVIERLDAQVDTLVLNANGKADRFEAFGLEVVPDTLADVGPLGGVLTGMLWGKERGFARITTVAADAPFLPRDLVARLQAAQDHAQRIVQSCSAGRPHPPFALWPVSLVSDLETFLVQKGPSSIRAFAGERHQPVQVDFAIDGDLDPFFNVNTPADLQEAERLAEAKG